MTAGANRGQGRLLLWYTFLHISNSGSQILYRLSSQALKLQALRIYHAMQDLVGWLV